MALAVYPGLTPATRPQAVVLVNEHDWPASLVASALASAPLGKKLSKLAFISAEEKSTTTTSQLSLSARNQNARLCPQW